MVRKKKRTNIQTFRRESVLFVEIRYYTCIRIFYIKKFHKKNYKCLSKNRIKS